MTLVVYLGHGIFQSAGGFGFSPNQFLEGSCLELPNSVTSEKSGAPLSSYHAFRGLNNSCFFLLTTKRINTTLCFHQLQTLVICHVQPGWCECLSADTTVCLQTQQSTENDQFQQTSHDSEIFRQPGSASLICAAWFWSDFVVGRRHS